MELPENEVHVWLTPVPDAPERARLAACEALLDESERERHARFRFQRDRDLFATAHALLRTRLSAYAPVAAADWRFREVAKGRPELAAPDVDVPLRFNLSHSEGLAACAIVARLDVGVDVESASGVKHPERIAERYFSSAECEALYARPEPEQRRRFLELWTLKEAYIKARGLGLQIPLGSFSFLLDDGDPAPRVRFEVPERHGRAEDWQFAVEPWGERHMLSVAVERGSRSDLRVRVRQVPAL